MATRRTPADRKRAAVAFVAHGTSKAAAAATGIPASTIRDWRRLDPDFQDLCRDAQTEWGEQVQAQYADIVERAGANVLDRLKHGDVVLTSAGEQVRVPVKARDAMVIAGIGFDKLRISQGQPTRITADASVRLPALLKQFQAIGEQYRTEQVVAVQDSGEPGDS